MNIKKVSMWLAIVAGVTLIIAIGLFFITDGENTQGKSSRNLAIVDVNDEKTFSLNGIKEIEVKVSSEDISFVETEGEDIKLHLNGKFLTTSTFDEKYFAARRDGEKLLVEVKKELLTGINLFYNSNIKLDILIPRTFSENLRVTASSANIHFDNFNAKTLYLSTTSGNLRGGSIKSNEAIFKTSSGKFTLDTVQSDKFYFESTRGDFYAKSLLSNKSAFYTSSGKISIDEFTGDIDHRSTRGDLNISFKEYANNIKIITSSGELRITLPENSEFSIDYGTSSGTLKSDFPIQTFGVQRKNDVKGIIKSDKNKIIIKSTSGDAYLKKK